MHDQAVATPALSRASASASARAPSSQVNDRQVGAEEGETQPQQRAVMARDSQPVVSAPMCLGDQAMPVLGVGRRAGGIPAASEVHELSGTHERSGMPCVHARRPQILHGQHVMFVDGQWTPHTLRVARRRGGPLAATPGVWISRSFARRWAWKRRRV